MKHSIPHKNTRPAWIGKSSVDNYQMFLGF